MKIMQTMLEGVGTGETWTTKPEKTGTAFHLFRKATFQEANATYGSAPLNILGKKPSVN